MSDDYDYERREGRHHHRNERRDEDEGGYNQGGGYNDGGYDRPPPRRDGYGDDSYDRPPPRREGYGDEGYDRPPRRTEYTEEGYSQGPYGKSAATYESGGYGGQPAMQTEVYQETYPTDEGIASTKVEVTRHKREEEAAGLGGLAAGAFALYERHEVKADPEHARRHQIEEEVAGASAVGAEGFALYEHHEKKQAHKKLNEYEEDLEEETGAKKHHHGFFS